MITNSPAGRPGTTRWGREGKNIWTIGGKVGADDHEKDLGWSALGMNYWKCHFDALFLKKSLLDVKIV